MMVHRVAQHSTAWGWRFPYASLLRVQMARRPTHKHLFCCGVLFQKTRAELCTNTRGMPGLISQGIIKACLEAAGGEAKGRQAGRGESEQRPVHGTEGGRVQGEGG